MSDTERVAIACPTCSPSAEAVHDVLSEGGGRLTVRCGECGHVHKARRPAETTVDRTVIVSQDGESFRTSVEAPPDERVRVGEEFVVDTEEAILGVRITDLEVGGERRVESAAVRDVETFWTRAVDNVRVNVTVHPADGRRDRTRSVGVGVPGDHEFEVGTTETFGDERLEIEGLHVRSDATGYPTAKLDRPGDAALAKDLDRVYAREARSAAWSAW